MNKKQNHYVYMIICADSDKYYIGRKSTTKAIDKDPYVGSGDWVKSIKDKTRLSKIILEVCNTFEELKIAELKWITAHFDDINNMNYWCSSTGAASGKLHHNYGKRGLGTPNYGNKHTEETKLKMSADRTGEKGYWYGKQLPLETRQKMSKAQSGENNPNYGRIGELNPMYGRTGELNPMYGKIFKNEHRQKMSVSAKGKHIGEKNSTAKLTEIQVLQIRYVWKTGEFTQKFLAEYYGIKIPAISKIINRITWNHI